MSVLVALASGKGGVGKSVVAANLAHQLALREKTVVLVDLDWGGSNAHTLLGVPNTNPGIGQYMADKECRLTDLVIRLKTPGLSFIPGDGQAAGAANLPFVRKQKLLRELTTLEADYVVLDLAAGSHYNTVDVFLSSGLGLLVTTPEPTALLNSYSFLKTALYRLLSQSVPAKSEARAQILGYFSGRRTDTGARSLDQVIQAIQTEAPLLGEKLATARKRLKPRVLVNQLQGPEERNLGAKLRQICEQQLALAIGYGALVPWDPAVRPSVLDRKLVGEQHPEAPFSRAIANLADRILAGGFVTDPPIGTLADLEALA